MKTESHMFYTFIRSLVLQNLNRQNLNTQWHIASVFRNRDFKTQTESGLVRKQILKRKKNRVPKQTKFYALTCGS